MRKGAKNLVRKASTKITRMFSRITRKTNVRAEAKTSSALPAADPADLDEVEEVTLVDAENDGRDSLLLSHDRNEDKRPDSNSTEIDQTNTSTPLVTPTVPTQNQSSSDPRKRSQYREPSSDPDTQRFYLNRDLYKYDNSLDNMLTTVSSSSRPRPGNLPTVTRQQATAADRTAVRSPRMTDPGMSDLGRRK